MKESPYIVESFHLEEGNGAEQYSEATVEQLQPILESSEDAFKRVVEGPMQRAAYRSYHTAIDKDLKIVKGNRYVAY